MKKTFAIILVACAAPLMMTCAGPQKMTGGGPLDPASEGSRMDMLRQMRSQFANVEISVNREQIRPGDLKVLPHLVKAAAIMDRIFWHQASSDGLAIRDALASRGDELSRLTVQLMDINFGPWNRLDHFKPFHGDRPRPEGVTFYPVDMTAAEFESFIAAHPDEAAAFQSWLTVIVREVGTWFSVNL